MTTPQLRTERLLIRLAEPADLPAILRFYTANAAHLAQTGPLWPPDFLTEQYWLREIARHHDAVAQGSGIRFALFTRDNPQQMVGHLGLNNIVRGAAQYADLGFALGADQQGQGLMSEAARAAIAFAFDNLALHRLKACYLPSNERSSRLLRWLGFVIEGYARDYLLIQGRWQDQILTSLINPRWQLPSKAIDMPSREE